MLTHSLPARCCVLTTTPTQSPSKRPRNGPKGDTDSGSVADAAAADASGTTDTATRKVKRVACVVCNKSHQRRAAFAFERCTHSAGIECMKELVASSGGTIPKCPAPDCSAPISWADFLMLVGPERYAEMAHEQAMLCNAASAASASPRKGKKQSGKDTPAHAAEVATLRDVLNRLSKLYDRLVSDKKSRKKAKKAVKSSGYGQQKTAWSKGVRVSLAHPFPPVLSPLVFLFRLDVCMCSRKVFRCEQFGRFCLSSSHFFFNSRCSACLFSRPEKLLFDID